MLVEIGQVGGMLDGPAVLACAEAAVSLDPAAGVDRQVGRGKDLLPGPVAASVGVLACERGGQAAGAPRSTRCSLIANGR